MGVKVGLSGLTFQLIFCDLFKVGSINPHSFLILVRA